MEMKSRCMVHGRNLHRLLMAVYPKLANESAKPSGMDIVRLCRLKQSTTCDAASSILRGDNRRRYLRPAKLCKSFSRTVVYGSRQNAPATAFSHSWRSDILGMRDTVGRACGLMLYLQEHGKDPASPCFCGLRYRRQAYFMDLLSTRMK